MARHRDSSEFTGFLGRLARGLARRAEGGDTEALVTLIEARRLIDDAIREAGRALHDQAGYSWAEIGREIGVSKQAAEKRFGSDVAG